MIIRTLYQKKIDYLIGKSLIKVITGQRRCGKSVLLRQICERFQNSETVYLDMENIDSLLELRTIGFAEYLNKKIDDSIKILAIDEIQKIPLWEEVIIGYHNKYPQLEIWITGSNSNMLSSDLTTLLRGRYAELHIYPFGFYEFCEYFKLTTSVSSFSDYLSCGGFPSLYVHKDDPKEFQDNAKLLIDSIFVNDIAERFEIQDMNLLQTLFLYIIGTIGNIFSYTSFVDRYSVLHKTSYITVMSYLRYMESSFMMYGLDMYDLQGGAIIQRQKKFYISDHSLRKLLFSNFDLGAGKELENVFFMEALRSGRNVYVGRIQNKEVDFIIEKGLQKKYIQVCYILSDENVIQREFGVLEAIDDNFPKYVISLDPIIHYNKKGIQHIQFRDMKKLFEY